MVKMKVVAVTMASLVLIASLALGMTLLADSDVKVAYSEKVNYETLIVANEKRWLEGNGIQGVLVTGGIQAAEALITGSVDMAVMGDGPAVQLITKGIGAKIVARFIGGEGVHRFIANASILVPTDIEGKTVGLQGSSSSHAAFLNWAQENGVNMSNDTVLPMNPMDIPLAMQNGDIQVMAGSEPWAVNTENRCGDAVHEIGNSSGLGSIYPMVLVASEKVLRDNPDSVRAMVEVMVRANEFINENWTEAMEMCSSRTGLSLDDQARCSAVQFYEVGFNETDVESINIAAEAMLAFNKINHLPEVWTHVDTRFLPTDE